MLRAVLLAAELSVEASPVVFWTRVNVLYVFKYTPKEVMLELITPLQTVC
jgi:hypothetical protein